MQDYKKEERGAIVSMLKKAVVLTLLGVTLVAGQASAAISSYLSYITISSADSSTFTMPYNGQTKLNTSNQAGTESSLSLNGQYLSGTLVNGTTNASGTYKAKAGSRVTYKVYSEHYELKNNTLVDYQDSSDTVTYNPIDWQSATTKQATNDTAMLKAVEEFEAEAVNTIAEDTGIDLSGYTEISKRQVFELDPDLFNEVHAITSVKNLEDGDLMPHIYLHKSNEKLYVLEKKIVE